MCSVLVHERFRLAQYALARGWSKIPKITRWSSSMPTSRRLEFAGVGEWMLVADLHNGVRLFRTHATR